MADLQKALNKRRNENSLRLLLDNSELIDFCSNNYLGLERFITPADIDIKLERKGSRLLSGHSTIKEEVESFIAQKHGVEAALIFNAGYMANLGLMSSVPVRGDMIIYDEFCHASIRDGIRLSLANNCKFNHNDLQHLEELLSAKSCDGQIYVVLESVYSMDGDGPDLMQAVQICKRHGANLIVDEAHSGGVYGPEGQGLLYELGLQNDVFAIIITYGKAFGHQGASVLGSKDLRDYLVNFSRPFIYTTAMPDKVFVELKQRYECISNNADVLNEIKRKKDHFVQACRKLNLELNGGLSGIYTILIGDINKAKTLSQHLAEGGFDVRAILSPTVPAGTERLRICIHAFNTNEEISNLAKHIANGIRG